MTDSVSASVTSNTVGLTSLRLPGIPTCTQVTAVNAARHIAELRMRTAAPPLIVRTPAMPRIAAPAVAATVVAITRTVTRTQVPGSALTGAIDAPIRSVMLV